MKTKLTLSIDGNLIELAKLDNVNISSLLEEYLKNYLETNSTEQIDNKISKLNEHINALNERKKQLLILGAMETKNEGLKVKIFNELKEFYNARIKQGISTVETDFQWLNSPKNLQRLKLLNKTPLEILNELKATCQ